MGDWFGTAIHVKLTALLTFVFGFLLSRPSAYVDSLWSAANMANSIGGKDCMVSLSSIHVSRSLECSLTF
jgi:hypothetical protein